MASFADNWTLQLPSEQSGAEVGHPAEAEEG